MIEALKAAQSEQINYCDEAQGGRLNAERVQTPQHESNKKTETQDQNRRLKAEHDEMQQKVLDFELQLEKSALNNKIDLQKKDDEIYELKMMLKHKDNELRTLSSNYDRTREDFTYRLQESLDRLHDRLTMEKHHDIQGINERNEVLIKQLVDF